MKVSKLFFLPISACVCLLLLSTGVHAEDLYIASTEDIGDWTKSQVRAYLDKYKIAYDQNMDEQTLMDTVKQYHDAAADNVNDFVSDKNDKINKLIDTLKIKLEKNYKISAINVEGLSDDIKHNLKQLQLSGSLQQEQVKQSLDELGRNALKKKYVTESQWKEIASDLESSFNNNPSWLQRTFSGWSSHSDPNQSIQNWVDKNVMNRLEQNKELTKQEIQTVTDTLIKAVSHAVNTDVSKLGDRDWWNQLGDDIQTSAKLKRDQVQQVVESIRDDVISYKIFVMDYANDNSQHVFAAAGEYIKNAGNNIYEAIRSPIKARESSASSAVSVASSAAASATDAAGESASRLQAQATEAVNDAKESFARYWKDQQLETYRKIGYTEAHINWIENYLANTFFDKTSYAKDTIQNAIQTIRQYLIDAKVQTTAHVDAQIKSLESLIYSWKTTIYRDEL
ncbi:hypothetical protein K501DRAFT_297833 [Backusella circina FSU 941]|nr:hypothetical protein K501DRAFT_297833 [Backusella circina FSU 941]